MDGAIAVSESCYTAGDYLDSEWPGESEAASECRGDSVGADEQPVDTGANISPDEHFLLCYFLGKLSFFQQVIVFRERV